MKNDEKASSSADSAASSPHGRRDGTRTCGRSGRLAILAAATAIGLAACGGGSAPRVANLGDSRSTGGGSTPTSSGRNSGRATSGTTPPTGSATVLLDDWAACMRSHGDPNQPDPTIGADGVIHIPWNPAIPGRYDGTNRGGQGNEGPGQYCRDYLTEAQTALQGGPPPELASQTQLLHFAECMRANGIPDFPDPVNGNLSYNRGAGGDLNPDNPTLQEASKLCAQKTGTHVPAAGGSPPAGTIEIDGTSPPASGGLGAISGPGADG